MHLTHKRPVRTVHRNHLMLKVLTALHELSAGRAGREELHDITDCLNVLEALACMGKCDPDEICSRHEIAEAGLRDCVRRLDSDSQTTVPEETLTAITQLVVQYDRALERLSSQTLETANRMVLDRIVAGQAEVLEA